MNAWQEEKKPSKQMDQRLLRMDTSLLTCTDRSLSSLTTVNNMTDQISKMAESTQSMDAEQAFESTET